MRKYLRQKLLLRDDLLLKKDSECVYFPILSIPNELKSYSVTTSVFEEKERIPASYKNIAKVPETLRGCLPSSYDVIGDIILLKLPTPLLDYQKEIGNALLAVHPNIRTVCLVDAVAGELRTRKTTVIAGERKTRTVHTEYGLSFNVDVQETYFSPRLASERWRVAHLVQPGETVIDMFAGVAPFSIMIARYAKPSIVFAVDKNEEAVALAKENVLQNRVVDIVEVLSADARDLEHLVPRKADRIIMNLPFSAHQFFSSALRLAAHRCIVHYYDIIKDEKLQERIEFLKNVGDELNFQLSDFSIRKMKSYAPREFYIGIDITATKHADVA